MGQETELFELSLLGGATERRYEALRGELELPWESLDPTRYPDDVRELARHAWTEVALAEFASASVHSELVSRLVQARAPLDLIGMATRFPLDELVHAELAARIAEALGGGSTLAYRPERLYPTDASEVPRRALGARVVDVCILESWSLATLRDRAHRAQEPLLKAVWARIAKDEALHARFGWLCLRWLLESLTKADRRFLAAVAGRTAQGLVAGWEETRKLPDLWFSEISGFGTTGAEQFWRASHEHLRKEALGPLGRAGIHLD